MMKKTGITMMMLRWIWLPVLAGLLGLAACSRPEAEKPPGPAPGPERLAVLVGIPPVADVVERVGGTRLAVTVLIEPGQNPHSYEPSPRQMTAVGQARIFFVAGMPFETRLVEKISGAAPGLTVVDVGAGIQKRMIEASEAPADEDEPDSNHDHEAGEPDPHIWLSPPLLKVIAANVAQALIQADPGHRADYRNNLAALETEIDAVHSRIQIALGPYPGRAFYVFHPAFGYFGDAYGLRQVAVEAGGKSPTPRQLSGLIERARAEGIKVIFVQPQYDQRSAETVARAIGGAVVPLDPLAHDVLANFNDLAAKMEQALK